MRRMENREWRMGPKEYRTDEQGIKNDEVGSEML
jgi:hypothetical protein